jgi:KDO2-lipid IV(A) lauroyltransferase
MARNQPAYVNWSQYLGARLAAMTLQMFDADLNLRTARFIGRIAHHFDKRHRERCRAHLSIAFPDWTDAALDQTVVACFEHLLQLVVEVIHTPSLIHRDSWAEHIRFHHLGPTLQRLNAGKPLITLTGHLGNWEVLGYFLAVLGYRLDAIARPLDNPLVNDWLLSIRQRHGLRVITKWDATDRMLEVLNSGGALAFIADQNAGDKGLFVPFFGKLASTYKSIGLLAISQNVPIVCGYARRGPGRLTYDVGVQDVITPDDWNAQPDPLFYVTARYMRAMELMIRAAPTQYLWMHRRWKSRPRFERQGKPMPPALRRNLEALPWMTPRELQRILSDPLAPPGRGLG